MNERIRELAGKALDQAVPETWTTLTASDLTKFTEKFAELIVRECSKWINDNVGLLDEEAQADLLDHFGVEE